MEPLWIRFDVGSDSVRILIEILLSTLLVLVFAEFLPRAIFRARANVLLSRLAQLIDIFYQMFYPIAAACIALANWLLKYVFNVKVDKKKEVFGKTDLEHLFRQAKEAEDEKQPLNTEFFENALEFPRSGYVKVLFPEKKLLVSI